MADGLRLFVVTVEVDIAVLARDEVRAEEIGRKCLREEVQNRSPHSMSCEVTESLSLGDFPQSWHDTTVHTGDKRKSMTIAEFFASRPEPAPKPLPGQTSFLEEPA